MLYHLDTN